MKFFKDRAPQDKNNRLSIFVTAMHGEMRTISSQATQKERKNKTKYKAIEIEPCWNINNVKGD